VISACLWSHVVQGPSTSDRALLCGVNGQPKICQLDFAPPLPRNQDVLWFAIPPDIALAFQKRPQTRRHILYVDFLTQQQSEGWKMQSGYPLAKAATEKKLKHTLQYAASRFWRACTCICPRDTKVEVSKWIVADLLVQVLHS